MSRAERRRPSGAVGPTPRWFDVVTLAVAVLPVAKPGEEHDDAGDYEEAVAENQCVDHASQPVTRRATATIPTQSSSPPARTAHDNGWSVKTCPTTRPPNMRLAASRSVSPRSALCC